MAGGETLDVRLELDTAERVVKPPADFVKLSEHRPLSRGNPPDGKAKAIGIRSR